MRQLAILDLDQNPSESNNRGHGNEITLDILHSEKMSLNELVGVLKDVDLPVFCSYPKREFRQGNAIPHVGHRTATIHDIYDRFKPTQIGVFHVLGIVKVNDSWVLHGKVTYAQAEHINVDILGPMKLIVKSVSSDRSDDTSERKLIEISKVAITPK